LKKEAKNFYLLRPATVLATLNSKRDAMSKSFLVLFFKKELLPFLPG